MNIHIIISQVGFCIAYLLFIGEQLDQVICFDLNTCGFKTLYIFLAFIAILPVLWLPSVKHLAYPAMLANIAILGALGIILYED